jgi:hypothetical protein
MPRRRQNPTFDGVSKRNAAPLPSGACRASADRLFRLTPPRRCRDLRPGSRVPHGA